MKDKIFEQMIRYGWNLGNNTIDDFENVYRKHYNFIQSLYDYFVETEDINSGRNLNDIDEQQLYDMISFMSDFLRAFNETNDNSSKKLNIIHNYARNRNIVSEQTAKDILSIIEDDEEGLEDLEDNIKKEIEYLKNKMEVCSESKEDMRELSFLEQELKEVESL